MARRSNQATKRRLAHQKLDEYINFLIDNPSIAVTDGTDGWTLSIDQHANWAAEQERATTKDQR